MQIKNNIPNLVTSLNLLSGCLAIIAIVNYKYEIAGILVFIAAGFDFLDGMAARALQAKTNIGKELDSLADVVSFGVVPGLLMFYLIQLTADQYVESSVIYQLLPWSGLLIPVFSAWRLAKFNIDERQTESFLGLPTPAFAFLVAALPLIFVYEYEIHPTALMNFIFNPFVLGGISLVFSLLLVSELPLFSLKFKNLSWKENDYKYYLIILAVVLLIFLRFLAIPAVIVLYILFSLIYRKRFFIAMPESQG
jgi:CDP-diacylglycerol---serine O-phosphatidyltransferase